MVPEFIEWCNTNTGFLTAVLSLIGLFISATAIYVSIRTARLPYKKSIELSSSIDIAFSKYIFTGETGSEIIGISINATNVGARNINITYLGISVRIKFWGNKQQKMSKITGKITGIGMIAPAEIKTELYPKVDLLYALSNFNQKAVIYIYARDTEGREYFKRLGYVKNLVKSLSS